MTRQEDEASPFGSCRAAACRYRVCVTTTLITVIPSAARNLALKTRALQDSLSPSAPRNDSEVELSRTLCRSGPCARPWATTRVAPTSLKLAVARCVSFLRMALSGALALLLVMITSGARVAHAQTAPGSRETIDAYVQRFEASYRDVRSLRADFTQTYSGSGRPRIESGVVWFARGGLMRWDYQRPSAKLFLCDGRHVWLYIPEEKQLTRAPVKSSEDIRVPFRLLLTRLDLRRVFARFEFVDDATQDAASRVLRGFPKKEFAEDYSDVLMGLDGQFDMRRLVVDLPDHTRMEFRFNHIDRNPPLDKYLFRFTPPPGTEIIDEK